ncbi:MAG TPA: PAS domain S-box protein, partial [Pirellulaceae bacterium]|nr:PAS domain S-box protein [Pirellulaceae bacterium]
MNASDENRRLRRTVRDLVALSTLPAVWIGLGPHRIASSLADVLLDTLSLDLIYVRLAALNGEGMIEFVRRKNRSDALPVDVARAAFAPLLTTDQTESSVMISDPFDGEPLHVTVIRFGGNDDQGVLVSGSCNPDFPTERDRALLGVGANQAAIVLQRRRAEEQVQEEREWLRVTLASIGDAVIATDTQGRVTYLNAVAEELTGWTPNYAEGEPLETVFPILNENTRLPVENPVERVLREDVVVGLANHTILIAKDGTERPIDDSAAPIRDAAGKIRGVVLIFRDVTEQRRAERELRESEDRKSAILETALDCIISMDHEGKVFDFNSAAERTFGYSRGDVIGRELADLIIPPSLRERHQQGMSHYLATGEGPVLGKRLELPALRADGSEFPVELAITRIVTDGPPLFTAYLRDISERTRAEQYRNARLGVTQVLNQASDVREGANRVLRVVCESLAWDVGFFWIVNKGGDGLECLQSWHNPELPVTEFEVVSFSRDFKKGEGLPGHVWSTGKPRWLPDVVRDANFPRAAFAAKYDLHSAFACPVAVGDRILGVIEFFTKRIPEPDADLLEMMGTVAASLGQFIERTTAEATVRQSEQELAEFFENATVGLHWVGPDGTILRANKAELDLLGYSREEYVGRHIADFHADEDVISDILHRLQTGEKLNDYPARLRCKDGSIRDVLIDSSVLFQEGGFVHTRCFTRDITERKRAEAAVRESEEKLRLLADTIPQLAWMAKPDGYIFWYNRRWYEYTGTTPDEMEGWGWQSVHDPETLPKVLDRWKGSIASGEPFDMVFPLRGEDKQFRPFLTRVNPLRDEQGRILYWFGTNTDIGDIRAMEEALRGSEQRFRQLADAMPQIVWTARPDGNIDYLNRRWSEFTGLPQTATNDTWGPLLHPDDAPAAHERWAACVQKGAPFEMELRLLDRRQQNY